MPSVNSLHQKAMTLVDEAHLARIQGDLDQFSKLTAEAFKYESQAAWSLAGQLELEPTRSVMFRSAASLALEIQKHREAEQLISAALAGEPPDEIANELRDLLENVYFARHLDLRGVTLAPGELQMSIDGDAVGFGITKSESFIQRLRDFEKLIYRTAERRLGRPFRERGRVTKDLADKFEVYLSVPRAASFAVTLRFGQSSQMELPGVEFSVKTLEDLLNTLEVFSSGDVDALEKVIPDETYRTNFIGLAERLSPDGKQVKTVGFTSGSEKGERRVALTKPKSELRRRRLELSVSYPDESQSEEKTIEGTLLEADATGKREGIIEVVDSASTKIRISVPRGMMSDIVKPMFEEWVQVVVESRENKLFLTSIDKADKKDSE